MRASRIVSREGTVTNPGIVGREIVRMQAGAEMGYSTGQGIGEEGRGVRLSRDDSYEARSCSMRVGREVKVGEPAGRGCVSYGKRHELSRACELSSLPLSGHMHMHMCMPPGAFEALRR